MAFANPLIYTRLAVQADSTSQHQIEDYGVGILSPSQPLFW